MNSKAHRTDHRATCSTVLLYSGELSGLWYYGYPEVHTRLVAGTEVELRREPQNAFDCFAIGVFYEGQRLGYIPRGPNEVLARMMDCGAQWTAVVESHEPGAMHWSCGPETGVYLVEPRKGGKRCIKLGNKGLGKKLLYCQTISKKATRRPL